MTWEGGFYAACSALLIAGLGLDICPQPVLSLLGRVRDGARCDGAGQHVDQTLAS